MSEPGPGPGSVLQAEREALGVTLREVSEALNLSITVIQSLEADDYRRLPGPVFVRGYVRAYARLLGLEPEPLLAQTPSRGDPRAAAARSTDRSLRQWIVRHPAALFAAVGALVLLAAVAMLAWWPTGDDAEATVAQAEQPPLEDPLRSVPEHPGPMPVTAPEEHAAAEAADPAAEDAFGSAGISVTAVEEPPAAGAASLRLTPAGEDRLALRFTADCWVQVRDADGADLYSNLGRAGTELELVGQGPLRILLGNAPGAQLAFNDEPVPLGPHTRNNVATLVLGQ